MIETAKTKAFPVIRIGPGAPADRGVQYGRSRPDLIRDMLDKTYAYYREIAGLGREECLALNARFHEHVRVHAPHLVEEMAGIADGAGLAAEEVFFLNYFVDVGYQATASAPSRTQTAAFASACTTYCATGKATTDGGIYVGQNNDYRAMYQDDMVIVFEELEDLRFAMVTYAGMVGESGLNSAGIAAVANGLSSTDAGPGIPFIILIRLLLEQSSVADALNVVINGPRASASNYVIGTADGDVFHVECSAGSHDILFPRDGVIGHTNHFTSVLLKPLARSTRIGNSALRLSRINRQLEDNAGRIDLAAMIRFSHDHADYPWSLCKHPSAKDHPLEQSKTLYSLIVQPDRLKMHVAAGNPCQHEHVEYAL